MTQPTIDGEQQVDRSLEDLCFDIAGAIMDRSEEVPVIRESPDGHPYVDRGRLVERTKKRVIEKDRFEAGSIVVNHLENGKWVVDSPDNDGRRPLDVLYPDRFLTVRSLRNSLLHLNQVAKGEADSETNPVGYE